MTHLIVIEKELRALLNSDKFGDLSVSPAVAVKLQ
jgi:hypothetical protein